MVIHNAGLPRASLKRLVLFSATLFMSWVIVSCGDSGGGIGGPVPPPDLNIAPSAIITITPNVAVPLETLTLSGSESSDKDSEEGEELKYSWEQTAGASIALANEDQVETSFVVPNVDTVIRIQLIVTDSDGKVSSPIAINIPVTMVATSESAIFVSWNKGNNNVSRSGSFEEPVATIGRAAELAASEGIENIYVYSGTYNEAVTFTGNINLVGGVTGADDNGLPTFGIGADALTEIMAPDGTGEALTIENGSNVVVKGFHIEGARDANECGDIYIKNSDNITLSSNTFEGSEECDEYSAVKVEDSSGVDIVSASQKTTFTITSKGSGSDIKVVDILRSNNVGISDISIVADDATLSEETTFTGIALSEVVDASITESDISVSGTAIANGISLACNNSASSLRAEHNDINILDAGEEENGIKIVCGHDGNNFNIAGNKINLKPKPYKLAKLSGVGVNTLNSDVDLTVVNNIVMMPVVELPSGDIAGKIAVNLSTFGSSSDVSIVHNTFLVTGNKGALYAVRSDTDDLEFSTINNIAFVYGSNSSNAIFSLPDACGTSGCTNIVQSNLLSSQFFAQDLPLIYHFDTGDKVSNAAAGVTNELEFMISSFFDWDVGELVTKHQDLVENLGLQGVGVSVDIDGTPRDGSPDIGATEY